MKDLNQSKIENDCATIASQNKFIAELQEQLVNSNNRSVSKISDDCATIQELMKQLNAPKIESDCNTIKELMKQLEELKQQQQPVVASREIIIENPVEVGSKIENDCATIAKQNKELLLKDQEIEQLKQQIQLLNASKIENDCATIASQNKIIEEQANEIKALKAQLANLSSVTTNNKIADDCATIKELMKERNNGSKIADDCATIKELMKQLNAPKIEADCATIAQQNQRIEELEKQLNSSSKIADDCATILSQNQTIQELKEALQSNEKENSELRDNNVYLSNNIKDLQNILCQLRITYFAERNKSDNLVNTIAQLKKENAKLSSEL